MGPLGCQRFVTLDFNLFCLRTCLLANTDEDPGPASGPSSSCVCSALCHPRLLNISMASGLSSAVETMCEAVLLPQEDTDVRGEQELSCDGQGDGIRD